MAAIGLPLLLAVALVGLVSSSDNDDDLVREVQKHGKDVHSMNATREEVLAMAQPE